MPCDVARAALLAGLVSVDPGEAFDVAWWRASGGGAVADQRSPDDSGTPNPHERVTLAGLGAELDRVRRERAPKKTHAALCGGAFNATEHRGESVFLRRIEHQRSVSLLELDIDGAGATGHVVTLGAGVASLRSLGVAAVAHPSPSATSYDSAARWRAMVRVAADGASSVTLGSARDVDDFAHAMRATGAALAAVVAAGAKVDTTVWKPNALGYTDRAHDGAAGPVHVLEGAALNPRAVRDALVAVGALSPYLRGAKAVRHGDALLTMLRELSQHAPGVIGKAMRGGAFCIVCPLAHLHTDPSTGRGNDTSCAVKPAEGVLTCSHQHQGRGSLSGRAFVEAIAERWPAFAPRAWALWGEARRSTADARGEVFAGAPGDVSDARVAWERTSSGAAVHVQSPHDAGENLAEDFRRTVTRWQNGDRTVRLRLDAVGTGKSTVAAAAVAALAPALPGELDNRRDTPRALGRYVVETGKAAQAIAREIDRAGRGEGPMFDGVGALFIAALRGRHARPVRAAQYLPLSAVSVNGTRVRAPRDGADDDDEGCAHACPHWKEGKAMEARGIDARTSLCKFAGTDDPRALRQRLPVLQTGNRSTACPKSRERGGTCVAEEPWHYSDGTSPQSGDAFVEVVTVAAAFASKDTVEGALTIVDETERAADPRPETILPASVDLDSGAAALLDVLRYERREHKGPRPLESARAVFRGLLSVLRSEGVEALYREGVTADGRDTSVAERVAWAVRKLDAWATGLDDGSESQAVFDAWASLYAAAADDDPPTERAELRARYLQRALLAFMRARPVVARWRRARRNESGSLDVGAEVWNALREFFAGAPVHRHYTRDESGRRGESSGGVVVLRWPPALVAARAWITRGPVVCLDATGDPAMVASALDVGGLSGVTGVRAIATELDGNPQVRRVMVATDRATRRVLLIPGKRRGDAADGGDDETARVRWHDPQGADAETLVRAVVATLRRDAPKHSDGRITPGVIVAARPLALALCVLHLGEAAALQRMGETVAAPLVSRAIADARVAPDAVRAAVTGLQGVDVWWTWLGSDLARGSNEPHEGGARWCVTIGDGLTNPADAGRRAELARRRDADGKPDATAQQRRDAAASLAQAHGRVRAARLDGPALLLHVGDVRPFDWPAVVDGIAAGASAPEYITLAALRESLRAGVKRAQLDAVVKAPAVVPAPTAAAAIPRASHIPAALAAVLDARWTVAAIARCLGVRERTVYRWCAGETRPGLRYIEALESLLDSAAGIDAVRAGYRAMFRRGRRARHLVDGIAGAAGVVWYSQELAGAQSAEQVRAGIRGDVTIATAVPLSADVFGRDGELLRQWANGAAGVEFAPHVVATLAAVLPAMRAAWDCWANPRPATQRARDVVERPSTQRAAPTTGEGAPLAPRNPPTAEARAAFFARVRREDRPQPTSRAR